jgi:hypothetical protein
MAARQKASEIETKGQGRLSRLPLGVREDTPRPSLQDASRADRCGHPHIAKWKGLDAGFGMLDGILIPICLAQIGVTGLPLPVSGLI